MEAAKIFQSAAQRARGGVGVAILGTGAGVGQKSISISIHMILHRAVLEWDKRYSFTLPMCAVKIARGLLYLETMFELGKTWRIGNR